MQLHWKVPTSFRLFGRQFDFNSSLSFFEQIELFSFLNWNIEIKRRRFVLYLTFLLIWRYPQVSKKRRYNLIFTLPIWPLINCSNSYNNIDIGKKQKQSNFKSLHLSKSFHIIYKKIPFTIFALSFFILIKILRNLFKVFYCKKRNHLLFLIL